MKKLVLGAVTVAVLALALSGATNAASNKVQVCHIPPGDPVNFHTITVNSNALNAHLGHGDLLGSCFEYCETLCDDGDACTVDACDPETEACLLDHPPVDCDDSDLCTVDSCDPLTGCLYAPIVCDDEDACTEDLCFGGECLYPEIDCGETELCDPIDGCYDPCGGVICDPIDQCHEPGECVFPGDCFPGAALPDGTVCDDGDAGTSDDQCTNGVCAGTPGECFNPYEWAATGQAGIDECLNTAGCPDTEKALLCGSDVPEVGAPGWGCYICFQNGETGHCQLCIGFDLYPICSNPCRL